MTTVSCDGCSESGDKGGTQIVKGGVLHNEVR